ncbi:complement resistance protein TraT [Sulfurimonas sp. RIFOXYB12_FULL_35_9]|uniref:complement resistance protein TraT n=1 Tax=Sulfurimonas sp. RIFOXYB12_FULL_35_9 TaxID=1802256 RepID=UPI0008B3FBF8|nr:complement resistance protein TraT [Sulfurimonas sp. RIFOXYB12_FULL_35_9]OHE04048.1 MAG: conjugal transfer protein TraT [Sulfurimonas sp. RIFOXYB12_FULL_35_9]
MKKTSSIFKSLTITSIVALGFSLGGCSAMDTAIKKKDLDVQTKMSETIFLEPVAPDKRIVYFDIRNTSDQEINIKDGIAASFKNRGYKVTDNPNEATYMLQGNILKVGKSDLRESQSYLGSGFGAGVTGAALGAGTAYALGGSNKSMAGVGLAGAALGFVGDALVKDIAYVMVTDLQIRERPLEGEVVTQTQKANLAQGSSTTTKQDIQGGKVEWKTYRTRIVSTANKMNLEFEEAKPVLESALVKSISGVF